MIDPAALGTLVIGLDHVRAQQAFTDRPAASAARPHRLRSVARHVAASLRWLADLVDSPRLRRDIGMEGSASD